MSILAYCARETKKIIFRDCLLRKFPLSLLLQFTGKGERAIERQALVTARDPQGLQAKSARSAPPTTTMQAGLPARIEDFIAL